MFTPYYKTNDKRSQSMNMSSHGLGLYIGLKIAKQLGGNLEVTSQID